MLFAPCWLAKVALLVPLRPSMRDFVLPLRLLAQLLPPASVLLPWNAR